MMIHICVNVFTNSELLNSAKLLMDRFQSRFVTYTPVAMQYVCVKFVTGT